MSDRIYDIDYTKLVGWLTPEDLRKSRLLRFVAILISPVVVLYQGFLRYRKAKLYELHITPAVAHLELLLNDYYDLTERRIYIDFPVDKSPLYIYQSAELKPLFIYQRSENKPVFLYTSGESGDNKNDFIIYVPLSIPFELAEMISLVKKFKMPGTKFKIQRF